MDNWSRIVLVVVMLALRSSLSLSLFAILFMRPHLHVLKALAELAYDSHFLLLLCFAVRIPVDPHRVGFVIVINPAYRLLPAAPLPPP